MKRSIKLINSFLIALMAMFACTTAYAKPVSEFDKLVKEGAKAYNNDDFDKAEDAFRKAYAIKAEPSLLYNIGRVCEDKANYNCAIDNYRAFIGSPGSDADAKEDAMGRIKICNEYIAILNTAPGAGAPRPAAPVAAIPAPSAAPTGSCIDLNSASNAQLQTIKGIGDGMANKIIDYRTQNGGFKSITDLQKIKGIGNGKTYEKFAPFFCPINGGAVAPAPAKAAPPAKPAQAAKPEKGTLRPVGTGNSIEI